MILITGSEGSLAQWMIHHHLQGNDIVGIDNHQRYGEHGRQRDYAFYPVDLRDREALELVFRHHNIKFVFHCAASIYGVRGFHQYSADILANNVITTANLAEVSVRHRVRKIAYISSSMVYERAEKFPLTESMTEHIAMPSTGYGFSKLAGERIIQQYHQQHGINYVIWRPFNIVTPHEASEDEPGIAHVMADFTTKTRQRQTPLEIFGDGQQTRCFTWIDDVAGFVSAWSQSHITDNQIYNVGSETPTRVLDLAEMIHQRLRPNDPFTWQSVATYSDDVKNRVPDCSRARSLGWRHTKTMPELVDICVGTHAA